MVRLSAWVPVNDPVVVAGYSIAGGLFYVGQACRSAAGTVEPAQVNPGLPVDPPAVVKPVHDLPPAPAYHLISSAQRAAYLRWLARGRIGDEVPLGVVQLFYSGLERRVLVDARTDPVARDEFAVIAAELRRLRACYGTRYASFGAQVTSLLEALDLLGATPTPPSLRTAPPAPAIEPQAPRWPVPTVLRVRLAQLANAGLPVPADWARSWAWYHPGLFPTTPQTRCPQEYDRLFALRYRRLPAGLVPVGTDRPPIRLGYVPINPVMDTVVVQRPELPDVLEEPTATRRLAALAAEVNTALTPYSRWLGRTPGGRDSVASTVLLPGDLLQDEPGPLRPLLTWTEERLEGSATAVVDASEFAPFWSSADPRRMSRDEAASFAVVLARIGLGVEPDARFGGPPLGAGPVVLFRLGRPGADGDAVVTVPSTYRAACHALSVVAAIWPGGTEGTASNSRRGPTAATVTRDGAVTEGRDDLVNRVVTALAVEAQFSVDERIRLGAHLRWLLVSGVEQKLVRRRAGALTGEQREIGAQLLLRLATESGSVGPGTVTVLTAGYRLLGLPEDRLYAQLHRAAAQQHELRPSSSAPSSSAPSSSVPASSAPSSSVPASSVPASSVSSSSVPVSSAPAGRCAGADVPRPAAGVSEPVPVLARRAHRVDGGHPLPWARAICPRPDAIRPADASRPDTSLPGTSLPGTGRAGSSAGASTRGDGGTGLPLQPEVIERRAAETEAVAALLAEVFTEDATGTTGTTGAVSTTGTSSAGSAGSAAAVAETAVADAAGGPGGSAGAGLDARHSGLLAELACRQAWTGTDYSALAAGHDLLPAGALEVINEVAVERSGRAVIEEDVEEDAVFVVDVAVARELLE